VIAAAGHGYFINVNFAVGSVPGKYLNFPHTQQSPDVSQPTELPHWQYRDGSGILFTSG
jgi:hypothetical protein